MAGVLWPDRLLLLKSGCSGGVFSPRSGLYPRGGLVPLRGRPYPSRFIHFFYGICPGGLQAGRRFCIVSIEQTVRGGTRRARVREPWRAPPPKAEGGSF